MGGPVGVVHNTGGCTGNLKNWEMQNPIESETPDQTLSRVINIGQRYKLPLLLLLHKTQDLLVKFCFKTFH